MKVRPDTVEISHEALMGMVYRQDNAAKDRGEEPQANRSQVDYYTLARENVEVIIAYGLSILESEFEEEQEALQRTRKETRLKEQR